MPEREPDADCPSPNGPLLETVPAGTISWRIHSARFGPTSFNPVPASDKRESGRFDSIDGDYTYLYAGETRLTAFAETFLRGSTVMGSGVGALPRVRLASLRLSRIETTDELQLVSLVGGEALRRIGQDAWLTACDESDYPITRRWARAIRRWAPNAHGFVWLAKRDNRHRAYILFGDRRADTLVRGEERMALDTEEGELFATKMLARLSVSVEAFVP